MRVLEDRFREVGASLLQASASRWVRRAFAFKRLISWVVGQANSGRDCEDWGHTIFLTCSGVRGPLGRIPGLEGAVCGGGVEGRSVMLARYR